DWVFDRTTRRHYMFGGSPNRPNDKSARFNDTWELQLSRPTSQDILRRTLYLVRQRRFLDMCAGTKEALSPALEPAQACAVLPDVDEAMDEYKSSAIPSPNSTMLDSPQQFTPPAKRHSPRLPEDPNTDPQSQRQRLSGSSMSSRGMACASHAASTRSSHGDSTAWALSYLQQCIAPLVNHNDVGECQSFHALSTALFKIPSDRVSANDGSAHQQTPETLRKARADVYEALLTYFSERQQQPPSRLDDIAFAMLD
ncbi:hypothetical protein GGI21_004197, partial [Coemansia aciculifera]